MGRAQTPHPLRGRIGNLIYRVRDGRQHVYMAQEPFENERRHRERMAHDRLYIPYRLNIHEFAGASAIASDIYRNIKGGLGSLFRPYSHNILTAALKRAGAHHIKATARSGRTFATEFRLYDADKAFTGLDLSHDGAPAAMVRMVPIGPGHNPAAIRVHGLRQAAQAIPCHGNARLELRVHIHQTPFQEMEFSQEHREWKPLGWTEHHQQPKTEGPRPAMEEPPFDLAAACNRRPSGWIPAEIIPADGILLDLHRHPEGAKYVTAVIIEWREVRAVGGRAVHHHRQAIVRIAAVHGTPEDFVQRPNPYTYNTDAAPGLQWPKPWEPATDWQTHPEDYLREALLQLRT